MNTIRIRERRGLRMLLLLLLGSLLALATRAQTGVICGTVTDARYKEPLIGATVAIEGTGVGAITDMDGNFRIERVEPGTYTLVASYVSYQTSTGDGRAQHSKEEPAGRKRYLRALHLQI